jgi:hypothetical protein
VALGHRYAAVRGDQQIWHFRVMQMVNCCCQRHSRDPVAVVNYTAYVLSALLLAGADQSARKPCATAG